MPEKLGALSSGKFFWEKKNVATRFGLFFFFLNLISFIAASQVPEMNFFLLKKFMTFEGKVKHKKKFKIHEKRRPLLSFCGKFKFFYSN